MEGGYRGVFAYLGVRLASEFSRGAKLIEKRTHLPGDVVRPEQQGPGCVAIAPLGGDKGL